jgi:hypothetical protein
MGLLPQRPVWQQSIFGEDTSPRAKELVLNKENKEAMIRYFINSPELNV